MSNFKFFVPFEIEKSKDSTGNEVMKIAGIASTADRDSDGEVLDPSGFDLSYFMNNGFINWHHQAKDKPEAIIGEPTKAEIRKEGLYVEGLLYPESKLAKQVFDLAKGLEKSSKNRRLGFSIEGKVIERDSLDNNFVKKAKITGLAVTPTPKNANTLVDIIKGNYNEFEEETSLLSIDSSANGGDTTLLDVVKPNGDRIIVDSNYNIKVFSKSADTGNAGVLSAASVEGKIKNLESDVSIEKKGNFIALNKSEIFVELLRKTDNPELARSVINKINFKDMNKPTVSLQELQKALSDIGVEVDIESLKEAQVKASDKTEDKTEKKSEDKMIEEIISEVDKKLGLVEKGLKNEFEKEQQTILSKVEELFKGVTQKIEERLSVIESAPGQRKSAPTANFIEKAFGNPGDKNNESKTVLSLLSQRQQISNVLLAKSGIEKGQANDFYANAMMELEATGSLSKAVIADLYANSNILVTQ